MANPLPFDPSKFQQVPMPDRYAVRQLGAYADAFTFVLPSGTHEKTINFSPGMTKLERVATELFCASGSLSAAMAVNAAHSLLKQCAKLQSDLEKKDESSGPNKKPAES